MRLALAALALAVTSCSSMTIIRSYPADAEVLVDGRPIGYTPAPFLESATWLSTRHVLTLYREGYAPLTTEISASEPAYARLVLSSLFCWPCLFTAASYPAEYDFPLTPRSAAEADQRTAYRLPSSAAK